MVLCSYRHRASGLISRWGGKTGAARSLIDIMQCEITSAVEYSIDNILESTYRCPFQICISERREEPQSEIDSQGSKYASLWKPFWTFSFPNWIAKNVVSCPFVRSTADCHDSFVGSLAVTGQRKNFFFGSFKFATGVPPWCDKN
ncbi:hypothetical protein ABW19_dt0210136 [Dactylella cylindrospora]|nr:hypothetical protein ABW19_dt0210136 [Dactylella cylindrospora]